MNSTKSEVSTKFKVRNILNKYFNRLPVMVILCNSCFLTAYFTIHNVYLYKSDFTLFEENSFTQRESTLQCFIICYIWDPKKIKSYADIVHVSFECTTDSIKFHDSRIS